VCVCVYVHTHTYFAHFGTQATFAQHSCGWTVRNFTSRVSDEKIKTYNNRRGSVWPRQWFNKLLPLFL